MTDDDVMDLLVREPAYAKMSQAEQVRLARELITELAPTATVSQSRNVEQDLTPPEMVDRGGMRQAFAETLGVGTETAGGVYGGVRGAASGAARGARFGPTGALVGGLAGGALGAAGGTGAAGALRQPTEYALGLQPRLSVERIGQDVMHGAEAGAIGELAGRGIIGGVNTLIARPLGRMVTGSKYATPEDLRIAELAEKMGITLRPSEVSRGDVAAQVEMNAARSMFGKSQFQLRDFANEKVLSKYVDDQVRADFGAPLTQQEAGATIQQIVKEEAIPAWKQTVQTAYEQVGQVVTKPVPMQAVLPTVRTLRNAVDEKLFPKSRAILDKIEQEITQPGPVTGLTVKRIGGEEVAPLERLKVTERSEAPRQPRNLNFKEAIDIRSYLLAIGREAGEALPSRAQGLAGKLAKLFDNQMENAARTSGPDAYAAWRGANKLVKDGHALYNSSTIQQLLKTNPEDVVAYTFKKHAITEAERVMAALKDFPEGQRLYRNAAMQKVLRDATADGFLNGQKLYAALYGKNGVGEEVIRKTFPSVFADELHKTADVARRMGQATLPSNAGNPSQTGRSLINWFEQSMLINIPADFLRYAVQGRFGDALKSVAMNAAQTGTYALTHKELATLLNSPEGLRILRHGLSLSPTQEGATRAVTQLFSIITKDVLTKQDAEIPRQVTSRSSAPRPTDLPNQAMPTYRSAIPRLAESAY